MLLNLVQICYLLKCDVLIRVNIEYEKKKYLKKVKNS